MSRAAAFAAVLALAVAGCAGPRPGPMQRGMAGKPVANPTALIAAEIAFNRLAQDKGQWEAFRQTATDDAVIFTPLPVNAQAALKGQGEPPPQQRLVWQPHQVWMSCDGSLGVTKGAWQKGDGTFGYFTTIWQRQKDGEYKWVLDQGDTLQMPLEAPEMISATVADCSALKPDPDRIVSAVREHVEAEGEGASRDGTLTYRYEVRNGTRRTSVAIRQDGEMREVLTSRVDPSAK